MEMQESKKSVEMPTGYHGVDYGEKKKTEETSLAVPYNDRVGNRYAQYNNISDDDNDTEYDEDEEQEGNGNGGLPVAVPSSSTGIVQQHQMPSSSSDGNIVLPNTDPAMYGDVSVDTSKNVHLGNKTFYKGSITIHQVIQTPQSTNPAPTSPPIDYSKNPSQNESNQETSGSVDDVSVGCVSDISECKIDVPNDKPIFQPNNELHKEKWKCATWKWCIFIFFLVSFVVGCTAYFTAYRGISSEIKTFLDFPKNFFSQIPQFNPNSKENLWPNNKNNWSTEAETNPQANSFINMRNKDRPTSILDSF